MIVAVPFKITVTRAGSTVTATDGKQSRSWEYKHLRAAALVAERLKTDKAFALAWLKEPSKPVAAPSPAGESGR